MSLQSRRLYIDLQSRQFVSSPFSSFETIDPIWIEEDVETIEIYALRPTYDPIAPYRDVDISGAAVKLAVGITAPAAYQSAWTVIPTTVTASVSRLVAGGSGASEIQKISFSNQSTKGGFAISFPARQVSVSSVLSGVFSAPNHGLYDGQTVALSGFTISGATFENASYIIADSTRDGFRIATGSGGAILPAEVTSGGGTADIGVTTTRAIPFNSTASAIEQIIAETFGMSVPQISVSGSIQDELVLTFGGRSSGRGYDLVSVVGSTLERSKGLYANVSFDTAEIAQLISDGNLDVTLEVEIEEGASRQTFRRAARLSPDLIKSGSPLPVPPAIPTSFKIQSPDGTVWVVSMTNDGNMTWEPE